VWVGPAASDVISFSLWGNSTCWGCGAFSELPIPSWPFCEFPPLEPKFWKKKKKKRDVRPPIMKS